MKNPFIMRVIPEGAPFANRHRELEELSSHARNEANVVLFSPRRYGKTSLARRIQAQLKQEGFLTVYADLFQVAGKRCPRTVAEIISRRSSQYPYYAQSLAYHTYEVADETVSRDDVTAGFEKLIASERYGYENLIKGLTSAQTALLKALAADPGQRLHTAEYMASHKLTLGGIQSAQKRLTQLDLIEKCQGIWRIVDPIFAEWLARCQT
ncbi:MAG: hypothetical protein JEZ11_12875 [Desulfobacterales bacterium]|nr:hypothetical protein [Desulfobacterales bacterium]